MVHNIFRKGLVIGIILLFVGTSVIPIVKSDDIPPIVTIELGSPRIEDVYYTGLEWLDLIGSNTPVWINSSDEYPGTEFIKYRLLWGPTYESLSVYTDWIIVNDNYMSYNPMYNDSNPYQGSMSIRLTFNQDYFHQIHAQSMDGDGYWNYASIEFMVDTDLPYDMDLDDWTVYIPEGGSAEIVTEHWGDQGTHYTAIDGENFILLKTDGPGSYTYAQRDFNILTGETISGWAAFDARDYLPFNDNAAVRILDEAGSELAVPWYSDISIVGNYGDGPWVNWEWTASVDGVYTLEFRVANDADSNLDSYALFDLTGGGDQPQEIDLPVDGLMIQKFRGYDYEFNFSKGNPKYDGTLTYEQFHDFLREEEIGGVVYKFYRVYHEGIDIDGVAAAHPEKRNISSVASGTIRYVDNVAHEGAGKWIWIEHDDDIKKLDGTIVTKISTRYLHLDSIDSYILDKITNPSTHEGEVSIPIQKDQVIGTVGNTGCEDTEKHLHFEVRQGDIPANFNHRNTLPLNPIEFVNYIARATITATCPIDLLITDPDGLIVSKDINQLLNFAQYIEIKYNEGDEKEETLIDYDSILFDELKIGDYMIIVIPETEAQPTDLYSIKVHKNGQTIVIVEDAQVGNIPNEPYIIRSSETELIPIMPVTIEINPNTLNYNSTGNWITCHMELPTGHGYYVEDINIGTIMLNDAVIAEIHPTNISDYDEDGIPDLMVKFDRQDVINILDYGDDVEIIITGELTDGTKFEGVDYIRVI